jgi:hypothetical protein
MSYLLYSVVLVLRYIATSTHVLRKLFNFLVVFVCLITVDSILSGSLVTTAWRVLRLRVEETASRYGR